MDYEKELERIAKEFGSSKGMSKQTEKGVSNWLEDMEKSSKVSKNVEKCSLLESGKLYYFDYIPLDIKILKYFDAKPLVISLFDNGNVFGGINLHYFPQGIDSKIISIIRNKLQSLYENAIKNKPYSAKGQSPIKIPNILLEGLKKIGIEFGIRFYNKKNIKDIKVICYEDWSKGFYLPSSFQGAVVESIYSDFYKKLSL